MALHSTSCASSVGVRTTGAGLALVLPPRKKEIRVGDLVLTREGSALTLPLEREEIRVESLILTRAGPALKFPPRRKKNEVGALVLTRAEGKIVRIKDIKKGR